MTLTGDLLGTLRYMSPEQALAKRVVIDGRTDVYSLGVTLYELLTLHPAFDGRDRGEILRRIADQEPVPLRTLNPAVPLDLETIVARAMDKEPAARYATASELAEDLRRFLEDRPIRARRPSLMDRAAKWSRRHRPLVASAAATVLAAALMLAGSIGYVVRDRAARLAQAGQRVAEALAGAQTAIQAADLTLASRAVAEANAYLGAERERLPRVAADIDRVRHDIDARQADEARLQEFLELASDAQDRMNFINDATGGDRLAREALGLYGVLETDEWLSRLENSSLIGDKKEQVRETAYVLLVSLADYAVRWPGQRDSPQSVRGGLDLLRRARAFHEPTRAFYFVRSECHRRQGSEEAAAEDVTRFQATPARTAWDYFLPGHTAAWSGDLEEAIRSYRAALRLQPDHYDSMFFLAFRFNTDEIDRRPEAVQLYTGCIALRPDSVPALVARCSCYSRLGLLDDAIADSREAIRLNPDYANAHLSLGNNLMRQGHLDEAVASFKEAIRLKPYASHHNNLGVALLRKGRLDEAMISFKEALRLKPDSAQAHSNLGLTLKRQDRFDEAIAFFKESLRLEPDFTDSLNGLAWLLATASDPSYRDAPRAVELARRALALEPKNGSFWNTLGVALYRNGDWAAAIEALENSEALLAPDTYPAHNGFFLAMAHWQRGEKDQARQWYDRAVAWMDRNQQQDDELKRFRAKRKNDSVVKRPPTGDDAPAQLGDGPGSCARDPSASFEPRMKASRRLRCPFSITHGSHPHSRRFHPFDVVMPIPSAYHNGRPQLVQSQGRTSVIRPRHPYRSGPAEMREGLDSKPRPLSIQRSAAAIGLWFAAELRARIRSGCRSSIKRSRKRQFRSSSSLIVGIVGRNARFGPPNRRQSWQIHIPRSPRRPLAPIFRQSPSVRSWISHGHRVR